MEEEQINVLQLHARQALVQALDEVAFHFTACRCAETMLGGDADTGR